MTPEGPVLIVGAGPVGLTAAAELARRGVDVVCVDAATEPSARSRALLVWPRTLEIMRGVGDSAEIAERSLSLDRFRYYSGHREVAEMRFAPRTRPVILPQPDVEDILLAGVRAAGADVRWGTRMTTFTQDHTGVRATLAGPRGREEVLQASYLIGCDGAGSAVRQRLGIAFQGATYPQSFMLADARVSGELQHDAVHYFCSDAGVLVMIGLPNGRFRVFTSGPPGSTEDPTLEHIQRLTDARAPIPLRLSDAAWTSRFSVHARRADRLRLGRAFSAGDAAHIHSPAGGQGMNTGVGDAHNLAWKLAMVMTGEAGPELLDTYEVERAAVAAAVVRQADLQTRAWLLRRPHEIALRDAAARIASRTGLLDAFHVPQLAGLRTTYPVIGAPTAAVFPARSRSSTARIGALVPDVTVQRPDGTPISLRVAAVREAYSVIAWLPGRSWSPRSVQRAIAAIGEHVPGTPAVQRLTGDGVLSPSSASTPAGLTRRPSWSLLRALGKQPAVVLVRPDGHVAAIQRIMRSEPAEGTPDVLPARAPREPTCA